MKLLLVGGTFDNEGGKCSGLMKKMHTMMEADNLRTIDTYNGGYYNSLIELVAILTQYDVVLWMPHIPKECPRIKIVKPMTTLLITSVRNDNNTFAFQELMNDALKQEAHLTIEFREKESCFFMRVFDSLGILWYEGSDLEELVGLLICRIEFLLSHTRKPFSSSDKATIDIATALPEQQAFFNLLKDYVHKYHKPTLPSNQVDNFLSCASFRSEHYVHISQENIDIDHINKNSFVPMPDNITNGNLYYCVEKKPSIYAPVMLSLFDELPNIHFMIHSHCYVASAPYTETPMPCGALDEADEILHAIKAYCNSYTNDVYAINLIGHGSILMGRTVEHIGGIKYMNRNLPENIISNINFEHFYADSDMRDFSEITGIKLSELYQEFYRRQTVNTPCEGCKHIAFRKSMYPCNRCSRLCTDLYETD